VHGNKTQSERMQHISDFRSGVTPVLVATGVMSRGLDIPGVTHVFIYDFPGTIEEYCHRIGRTARGANGRGEAVSFFEFFPCMPRLPGELVDLLRRTGQAIPPKLESLAADMASGVHKPAELGDWNADGQRCWYVDIKSASRTTHGWFLLLQDGLLQTQAGDGRWELLDAVGQDSPSLAVTWNDQRWELSLDSRNGYHGNKRFSFWSKLDDVELSGLSMGGNTHRYMGE